MTLRKVLGALVLSSLAVSALAQQAAPPTLYKRLGGYDAIAAVTDEFIGRLATDKTLGRYFVGLSDNSKAHVRQLVVDQICAATGGPCVYLGRDMKTTHKGLGITSADWDIAVKHFLDTLAKFQVPKTETDELVAIVAKTKPDIVEKP